MLNKQEFSEYTTKFLEQNAKLNLISKNDEKYLWEKHIFDSLAIEKFFENFKLNRTGKLLDIGTGGGFPSLPIAIHYSGIQVFALDSIRKKITAITTIAQELSIKNFTTICDRAENLQPKYQAYFDIITSRAVAPLKTILEYGLPLLKKNGHFIAYKSIKTDEEIFEAKKILKKYNSKIADIISYELPLEENHVRKLIIISK